MYAAKVKLGLSTPSVKSSPPEHSEGPEDEVVGFSAGNPRVEHITGVVHLFRTVPDASQDLLPAPALPVSHYPPLLCPQRRQSVPPSTFVYFVNNGECEAKA